MRVPVVAVAGLVFAAALSLWPAPVRSADPVTPHFPAPVFRGGNQGWGLIFDSGAKPLRYDLVVPKLAGVAHGGLIQDPQVPSLPGRYALVGRVNINNQLRELVVRINKAGVGKSCLDSAGKAHPYAVIVGAAQTANWYGCGDFSAQ